LRAYKCTAQHSTAQHSTAHLLNMNPSCLCPPALSPFYHSTAHHALVNEFVSACWVAGVTPRCWEPGVTPVTSTRKAWQEGGKQLAMPHQELRHRLSKQSALVACLSYGQSSR
jgi:hypothetical protein